MRKKKIVSLMARQMKKLGYSERRLAAEAGVSRYYVRLMKAGDKRLVVLWQWEQVFRFLGIKFELKPIPGRWPASTRM